MVEKNPSVSEQTKLQLAAALKILMAQKSMDKITIAELTNLCNIRRQSFYYHFEDIYDLLRWMIENEAISLLKQQEGALLWKEGLLQLFRYLEENRTVCLCALKSVGRDHLRRFFEADIYAIIHRTIEQLTENIGVHSNLDSFVDVEMLTHFYVVALAGMIESWLLGEIDRTPEQLIQFVDIILNDQINGAAARVLQNQ
jgi:probable dihydroxyacetone kinase regulator